MLDDFRLRVFMTVAAESSFTRAAQHLGVKHLDESFADLMLKMTDEMTPYSPSMRLDYDFHRPMEITYIYARPIEIAKNAGFPMPKLEMLMQELEFLDQH